MAVRVMTGDDSYRHSPLFLDRGTPRDGFAHGFI